MTASRSVHRLIRNECITVGWMLGLLDWDSFGREDGKRLGLREGGTLGSDDGLLLGAELRLGSDVFEGVALGIADIDGDALVEGMADGHG